jgi:hypothetical protein
MDPDIVVARGRGKPVQSSTEFLRLLCWHLFHLQAVACPCWEAWVALGVVWGAREARVEPGMGAGREEEAQVVEGWGARGAEKGWAGCMCIRPTHAHEIGSG